MTLDQKWKCFIQRLRFAAEPGVAGDDGWEFDDNCACLAFRLRFGEARLSGVEVSALFFKLAKLKLLGLVRVLFPSSVDATEVAGEDGLDINSGFVISSGKLKSLFSFGKGSSSNSFSVSKLYMFVKWCQISLGVNSFDSQLFCILLCIHAIWKNLLIPVGLWPFNAWNKLTSNSGVHIVINYIQDSNQFSLVF